MGPDAVQLAGGESLLPGVQLQPPPDRGEAAQHLYLQSSEYLQILSTLSTGGEASLSRDGQLCLDVLLERQVTSYLHTLLYLQFTHLYLQYLRVHLNLTGTTSPLPGG